MDTLPIIGPAINLVADFIRFIRDNTGGNLGVTIIIFTIFIKSLLAPLTFKSIKSSKAMQDVAPIIKELQKKYKDDRQTFAAEQMKVYQQYGINPLAGCLPVLIQLPVFLVVYQAMLKVAADTAGSHRFLWVADLTKNIGSAASNGEIVDPLRILVFLAFIFQIIQTRMSMPNRAKRAAQDQQTKMQSTLITVSTGLVLIFGWTFLAAMVLYWAMQAVYSAVQQYFITGWGAWTDLFPFLPVKEEPVRELKAVPLKEPGRWQRFMMQAQAAQPDRPPEQGAGGKSDAAKQQQLDAYGRPKKGGNLNISANRAPTPPQRAKQGGTAGMNGPRTPAARSKGNGARVTGKAIGTTETGAKAAPPVPRKSRRPMPDGGGHTGDGGE